MRMYLINLQVPSFTGSVSHLLPGPSFASLIGLFITNIWPGIARYTRYGTVSGNEEMVSEVRTQLANWGMAQQDEWYRHG